MKFNLSGWKKIKEDSKSAVMRHDSGHELTLHKRHLPPHVVKQLSKLPAVSEEAIKMAEGGSPAIDQNKAKSIQKGATESGWQPDKWKANAKSALALADGGKVADKGPYVDPKKAAE